MATETSGLKNGTEGRRNRVSAVRKFHGKMPVGKMPGILSFIWHFISGEAATVGVSFDCTNLHFTFAIPRGVDGTNGTDSEVTAAALAAAITTTSSNTNNVPPGPARRSHLQPHADAGRAHQAG